MLVVVLAGVILGGRWIVYSRTHVSTDDAQIESDIYPVSARVAGHVRAVYVDTNQQVRAGQVLLEIDPRDYQVAVQQGEAALAQAASTAQAAGGTVGVTERTGSAGISQAKAALAAAQAQRAINERQSESAAGAVEAARADEKVAGAAVEVAGREVVSSQAAVTSARARADEAEKDAARMEKLLAEGAISTQQRDAAEAARITAQANVEAAQAQLRASEAGVTQAGERLRQAAVAVTQALQRAQAAQAGVAQAQAAVRQAEAGVRSSLSSPVQVRVRRSEAQSAQAQVAGARARLEQAQLNLSYTRIVSPVDGTVAQKNVEPGQFVQPGQPLFAVVPQAGAYVAANFKETQLACVRVGQRATFTVDSYPGISFSGRVESLSPGTGAVFSLLPPENASGNFTKVVQRVPVRIRIDQAADSARSPAPVLRAGMSVIAAVETK